MMRRSTSLPLTLPPGLRAFRLRVYRENAQKRCVSREKPRARRLAHGFGQSFGLTGPKSIDALISIMGRLISRDQGTA